MRPFCPSIEKSGRLRHGTVVFRSGIVKTSDGLRAPGIEYIVEASASLVNSCGKGAVFDMRRRALKGIFGVTPFIGGEIFAGGEGNRDRVVATLALCHL